MKDGKGRSREIDAVKGLAIIGVILGHAFSYALVEGSLSSEAQAVATQLFDPSHILTSFTTYSALTTQQVVPIFIFIMAINYANSFKRHGYSSLKVMYSWSQFWPRLRRFLIPLFLIYVASLAAVLLLFLTTGKSYLFISPLLLIGYLPVNGPGNYFIPLVLQFLLIFPLVFYCFQKRPLTTVAGAFIIGLMNEFALSGSYLVYQNSILRLLPLISVGMLLSGNLTLRNRWPLLLLGSLSFLYLLIIGQFTSPFSFAHIYFMPLLNAQKLFASFYVAVLVLVLLAVFVRFAEVSQPFAWIGKRSYTIFLFQILFFATIAPQTTYTSPGQLLALSNLTILLVDLSVCILVGALFDSASRLWSRREIAASIGRKQSEEKT